jgi:hypothetical protein
MYQGRWTAHLPPRFAVLPVDEAGAPEADILFVEIERTLEKIGRPAQAPAT